jgi:hypothetical protein
LCNLKIAALYSAQQHFLFINIIRFVQQRFDAPLNRQPLFVGAQIGGFNTKCGNDFISVA